jgi:hypothetical protein
VKSVFLLEKKTELYSTYLYIFYILLYFIYKIERRMVDRFQKLAGSVRILLLAIGAIRAFQFADLLQSQQLIFAIHVNVLYCIIDRLG